MLSHVLTPLFQTASPAGSMVKAALPLFLIISCGVLALQPELRMALPMLVGSTALMSVLLAFALYYGERGRLTWSPVLIMTVALALRLMFLFSPPQLSDDIYRYLWDGGNLLRGTNPYAAAPADIPPPPEQTAVHAKINHPEYVTIYPPAAQLVFAGGAAFGGTVTGLKAFLTFIDLGLCALLIVLLNRLGLPPWRSVLYAWNPLPVLEIAGSGHVDGVGLAMLIGSICLLVPEQQGASTKATRRCPYFLSGALLACTGLVKLFPMVLLPVLLLLVPAGRRRHFVSGFIAALAALLLPFLPQLVNMTATLDIYARNWEFAGFAFNTARALTGSGTIARILLATTFLAAVIAIACRLAIRLKVPLFPANRGRELLRACYATAMALLLLTPTLQPWYALSLAVFLPFCAGPAGLVLCWAVFLTYRVQILYLILGQWVEDPQVTAAVFMAPVTAFLLSRLFRKGFGRAENPGSRASGFSGQDRFGDILVHHQGEAEGEEEKHRDGETGPPLPGEDHRQ